MLNTVEHHKNCGRPRRHFISKRDHIYKYAWLDDENIGLTKRIFGTFTFTDLIIRQRVILAILVANEGFFKTIMAPSLVGYDYQRAMLNNYK